MNADSIRYLRAFADRSFPVLSFVPQVGIKRSAFLFVGSDYLIDILMRYVDAFFLQVTRDLLWRPLFFG